MVSVTGGYAPMTLKKMNNKESELNRIIDVAISCCKSESTIITKEDILGKSRKEECVWARTIVVALLSSGGYLTSTIATALNRTTPAIRHLMKLDTSLRRTSRAYRIAYEEACILAKSENR